MSSGFDLREIFGSKPRYLYTFAQSDTMWRVCSDGAPVTVVATGMTYVPAMITHGRMERNAEVRAETIPVKVVRTAHIASALREFRTFPMMLRIEKHQPDDDANEPIVLAFGDVAGVRLNAGFVEFDLVTGDHVLQQPFPTKLIQRQSPWAPYSAESGIDETDFSFDTTITDIARGVVTVASIDGNDEPYYDFGQLTFGDGATAERVFVNYHVGLDFHFSGKLPPGVIVGSAVTLIAGNDGMLKTAIEKFGPDAVDRFLGFDLLPSTDPLQTGLVTGVVAT